MAEDMNLITAWMQEQQKDRSPFIGPSGATDCIKRHGYRYLGIAASDGVDLGSAHMGTMLHLAYSQIIRESFSPDERDTEVEIDWGGPRPGSADDVDYVNRVVTDLKSTSGRSLAWWMEHGVTESYWEQLSLYGLGLYEQHRGNWTLRITAIVVDGNEAEYPKGTLHTFEQPLDVGRAEALRGFVMERHERLMELRSRVQVGEEPGSLVESLEREGDGPGTFPCDWCEFASRCWPVPTDLDRTPQSETIFEDEAKVGEVAAEYKEWAARESEAKREKKKLQAFLKGVTGVFVGPDGATYTVTKVGGEPKQVVDTDALVARVEEIDGVVPMKWSASAAWPRVTKRKGSS